MSWNHNSLKKTQLLKHRHMFVTHAFYCSSKDTSATHDIKLYKYIDVDDSQSSSATLIVVQYSSTRLWIYNVQPAHSE